MSLTQQSVYIGANLSGANSAIRETATSTARQGKAENSSSSDLILNPDISEAERVNDQILDVVESQGFNNAVTIASSAVSVGGAAIKGGGGLMALKGGSFAAGAAGSAAASAFACVASGFVGGMIGGYFGVKTGNWLGHTIADAMGMEKVATDGDQPARIGDDIAHQEKDRGLWGAIGGIIAGAAAAIGTGLLIAAATTLTIATGGVAAVVIIGACALVGGFVGGTVAATGAALGEYGEVKGKILEGSGNVLFNGLGVARMGDKIQCEDHPGDGSLLAEGAETVFANNQPIVRLGHRTTCDGNVNSASPNIVITKATGASPYEIMDSRNPVLRWAVPITAVVTAIASNKAQEKINEKYGPKTTGDSDGPGVKPDTDDDPPATSSNKGDHSNASDGTQDSDPVDMATGDYIQEWPVITIPGVLPLTLRRLYRSGASFTHRGFLGKKWVDSWSSHLVIHADTIDFITEDGATLTYLTPYQKVSAMNTRKKRYLLHGHKDKELVIFDQVTQRLYTFGYAVGEKRRLSKIEDRLGNAIHFEYQTHQLCRIVHSDGYELVIEMRNQLIYSIELMSESEHYTLLRCQYDAQGHLRTCDSFQFGKLFHEYTKAGYMSRWRDTEESNIHIAYNKQGQVRRLGSKEGYFADEFRYYPEEQKTSYLNAEGAEYLYYYNEYGLVTQVINPEGHIHRTDWNGTEKMREIDALGRETYYGYAASGQLIRVVSGKHRVINYVYNQFGQLTQIKSSAGDEWYYKYDQFGRLRETRYPAGDTVQYRYNRRGQVVQCIHSSGQIWRYQYDHTSLLQKVIHPDQSEESYQMDRLQRIYSYTDPLGNAYAYEHSDTHANPAGSVTVIKRPEGIREEIRYTGERLVGVHIDGEGKTQRYTYGAFDLPLIHQRADGKQVYYHYDRLTRFIGLTNAKGEQYQLIRNALGQIVEEIDFTGRIQQYRYDAVGRMVSRSVEAQSTTYQYDDYDRLMKVNVWQTEEKGSRIIDEIQYTYNKRDQLISARNSHAAVELHYDPQGHLIGESINGHRIDYERDEKTGAIAATHHPLVNIAYEYTEAGRLQSIAVNEHDPLQLEHNARGQETLSYSAAGFFHSQQYNAHGLLHSQQAGHHQDAAHLQGLMQTSIGISGYIGRQYHYDKAFNVTGIDDRNWGKSQYYYDQNDQVTGALVNAAAPNRKEQGFNYDANLNLITRIENLAEESQTITQKQQHGRILQQGNCRYHYNAQGQLIEKHEEKKGFRTRIWRYQWNGLGQLTGVITPEHERWHYAYDAFGRRIRKFKVINGGKPQSQPLVTAMSDDPGPAVRQLLQQTRIGYDYFWSGNQLVEEIPLYADGTLAYEEAICWLYKGLELVPFARYEAGQLHYVISDQIGTPKELLDEWGKAVWLANHDLWGELRQQKAANDDDQPSCNLRFLGQYADEESGLHYNRFRYYDPATAQYISADPIGLAGGINPYGYVHNPTGWVDPLGWIACPYDGYYDRKADRKRRFNSSSAEYDKHTKATSQQDALNRSKNGGAAQYWDETIEGNNMTSTRNQIEKEALRNGTYIPQDGGSDYYVYDAGRTVGYNNGKPTQYVRVEVTKNPNPEFHGHPISQNDYNQYLKGK